MKKAAHTNAEQQEWRLIACWCFQIGSRTPSGSILCICLGVVNKLNTAYVVYLLCYCTTVWLGITYAHALARCQIACCVKSQKHKAAFLLLPLFTLLHNRKGSFFAWFSVEIYLTSLWMVERLVFFLLKNIVFVLQAIWRLECRRPKRRQRKWPTMIRPVRQMTQTR